MASTPGSSISSVIIMSLIVLCSLQLQYSSGTHDYYFGFFNTKSMTSPEEISILVITPESQSVYYSIEAPGEEYYTNGTITSSEQISVNLPTALTTSSHDDRDKGIHLMTSSDKVTVIGQSFFSNSGDTFLGLAATNVCDGGCVYYGISVPRNTLFNKTHNSSILVVGTKDNTMMKLTVTQPVTISVSDSTVDLTAGMQYSFVINRLQTVLIGSVDDLTGTKIVTDKPVSVLSGHQCGNVPVNVDYCDHLIEQVPPTTLWGRVYYTAPLATRRSYTIKVVAAYNSTVVDIYCSNTRVSYNVNEGDSVTYTVLNREYCSVHSDKRLLVVQFSHGQDDDNINGDPMMTLVPATNQYNNRFKSSTLQGQSAADFTHYISIIVLAQCYQPDMIYMISGGVNRSLDTHQWVPIMVNDVIEAYSVHLNIQEGVIEVFHSNPSPCLATILYGFDDHHAYGHPGGMYLKFAALFQLRLDLIEGCVGWTGDNQKRKLLDIKLFVMENIKQKCFCEFNIVNAAFSCRESVGDFKETVVYRAKVLSNTNAEDIVNGIDHWVKSETSITVDQVTLHVDPSCPSMLESFESRDCVVINQSSSSDDPPVGTIVGAAIGGVIGIIVIVAVLLIIMRCNKEKTKLFPGDHASSQSAIQNNGRHDGDHDHI
ncbi:uncharacterized protein [Dysidea avara]|uniref:uncharacterized protein isoform X2 n=1 Tax=Dysidea avara TaxID=196820 RepID=UPI00331BE92E